MVRRTHGTGELPEDKDVTMGDQRAALAPGSNTGADATLLSFVERFERLAEEKAGLADDMSEVMAEAKSHGFDTKIMRKAIARRAMDPAARMEGDSLLGVYEEALDRAGKNARQQSVDEGSE